MLAWRGGIGQCLAFFFLSSSSVVVVPVSGFPGEILTSTSDWHSEWHSSMTGIPGMFSSKGDKEINQQPPLEFGEKSLSGYTGTTRTVSCKRAPSFSPKQGT